MTKLDKLRIAFKAIAEELVEMKKEVNDLFDERDALREWQNTQKSWAVAHAKKYSFKNYEKINPAGVMAKMSVFMDALKEVDWMKYEECLKQVSGEKYDT